MNKHVTEYAFLLALSVAISAPMAVTHAYMSTDGSVTPLSIREAAIEDILTRRSEQRKLYFDALDIYRDLQRRGAAGIQKPDVNDMESIMRYLDADTLAAYLSSFEEGDTDESITELLFALPSREKARLERYVDFGRCPTGLVLSAFPGMAELCERMLERKNQIARDQLRGSAPGRQRANPEDQIDIIRLRLKAIEAQEKDLKNPESTHRP